MIVPMKRMFLLCVADDADRTLERLRDLGAVHLELAQGGGEASAEAHARMERAERALRIVRKAASECGGRPAARTCALGVDEVLALDAKRESIAGELEALRASARRYGPFGDFDPELAKRLESSGVRLELREDGSFEFLYGTDGDSRPEGGGLAESGVHGPRRGAGSLPLPSERLSVTLSKISKAESEIAGISADIASADAGAISGELPRLRDAVAFAAAKDEMSANLFSDGAVPAGAAPQLAVVRGWIAADSAQAVGAAAREFGWGLALRDPNPGETPPTLIRPPKLFRPVRALFDGLGIAPAYSEADVSVPFMCYFSLFFAMLVGDGAYGAIFLAATLFGWVKTSRGRSPVVRSWLLLMTVFSISTVLWGLLSNTWFGAQIPWCADWPTVRWLADPSYSHMMLLCFTIGASHLMLARVWNGICTINDSTCVAQFGWAGVILFMYFVTNSIVGIFSGIPQAMYWVFGVSLAMVFGFSVKPSELKSRGAELGMLPLNIMSALGDIISYVRLFAVGLASVKVAENFNAMATGLLDGADSLWLKAVMAICMVAILVLGHALNLAMAGLSILVHAVRLNTLEFSNHKGVSWAGYSFRPFRKTI